MTDPRLAALDTKMRDVKDRIRKLDTESGAARQRQAIRRAARAANILGEVDERGPVTTVTVAPDYRERKAALVAEYNGLVAEYNAIAKAGRAARQRKASADRAAATRAASCPSCFTVHAGDCY